MSNHDILTLILIAVQIPISVISVISFMQPSDPDNPQPLKYVFLTVVMVTLSVAGFWLFLNTNAFNSF
jgi:surface polysaccharide O-acyltransferase-like enzyme